MVNLICNRNKEHVDLRFLIDSFGDPKYEHQPNPLDINCRNYVEPYISALFVTGKGLGSRFSKTYRIGPDFCKHSRN